MDALAAANRPLQVGDRLPEFKCRIATATDVREFDSKELLGKGPIVLAFIPLAFTGVCTAEFCEIRDSLGSFASLNAAVYGVSIDSAHTNRAFIQKEHLPFPILSDPNRDVIPKFGVVAPLVAGVRNVAKRSVFVADATGRILYTWVSDNPELRPDFEAVRAAIRKAGA